MRVVSARLMVIPVVLALAIGIAHNRTGPASAQEPSPTAGMNGVTEVIFAERKPADDGHWYANIGYKAYDPSRKNYRDGGRLCKLDLTTGKVTALIDDPKGGIRDPQVHYDGKRIIFSWRRNGGENYNLYEINSDGAGLKQITSGPYDDFEPTYTSEGSIMFVSTRCNRWVNCWLTPVAIIYKCDSDGNNIHPISCNTEQDNTPWPLPDGRILYMRWEYVDRSQVDYHHLWTMNPDGTGQMVYYGNFHPSTVMLDAKPIPNTDKVVSIFSPGHGMKEHEGFVTVVDPKNGPDSIPSARRVSDRTVRDPWAFSENCFMAASGASIVVMDGSGRMQTIYTLPEEGRRAGMWIHEPRPLCPRPPERQVKPKVKPEQATGTFVLADVYTGRRMDGVKRGDIKKLLILELLPKPINYTGGMEPMSYGGTFTLERVLGTVPVEPDGSAYFEVPAMRSVFFVALDENNMSVKRMQSWTTVMPGEINGCVGCHEQRERTSTDAKSGTLMAVRRPPSKIRPIAGVPDVIDFPRDIQPILDKHCVTCHNPDDYKAGLDLTGGHGPMYSLSYIALTVRGQFADGRNRAQSNYPPRALGSSASPLLNQMNGGKYGVTAKEFETVRLWIESGAAYPGTYSALGTGSIGQYTENNASERYDLDWASTRKAREAIHSRCASCHSGNKSVPDCVSNDGAAHTRHLVYNLTLPEKSLMLKAPLATSGGGHGTCKDANGKPVFADTSDPDYKTILAMIDEAHAKLNEIKRFDMPGFIPRADYIREMRRYGLIDKTYKPGDPIDCYALDRKYWESMWYRPPGWGGGISSASRRFRR